MFSLTRALANKDYYISHNAIYLVNGNCASGNFYEYIAPDSPLLSLQRKLLSPLCTANYPRTRRKENCV